jgi:phage terminase Nu1 subunit (DNA packaging protein)
VRLWQGNRLLEGKFAHLTNGRYFAGEGIVITPELANKPEEDNASEAKLIETPCGKWSKEERIQTHEDCRNGIRRLSHSQNLLQLKALELRRRRDLDQTGTIRQIQTPIQVGCSRNMGRRVWDHSTKDKLSRSSKAWALLVGCLTSIGLSPEWVSVPVVKVWKREQLEIAEILVTMLAGSLICDGGLNGIQPGTQSMEDEPAKFELALRQIFKQKTWTEEQIQESATVIENRIQLAKRVSYIEREGIPALKSSTEDHIDKINTATRHMYVEERDMQVLAGKMETKCEEAKAVLESKQAKLKQLEGDIQWYDDVSNWLDRAQARSIGRQIRGIGEVLEKIPMSDDSDGTVLISVRHIKRTKSHVSGKGMK